MQIRLAKRFALSGVLALAASAGSAATLTVHKTSGPHLSVNSALAAATAGDTIQITDNSSTYTENLYITKNNITIQSSLSPAPVIQGVQATHPLAGSVAAPQRWFWSPGDANSANTVFDEKGAAVVNAADGLTLRGLKIKCEPTSSTTGTSSTGLLDFRFGTNGLVEDCYLDGSGVTALGAEVAGAEKASLTANNHTFRDCTFYRGNVTLEHEGGAGTLLIEDCLVTGPVHAIYIHGGTAVIKDTSINYFRASNGARLCEIGNNYGHVNVLFQGCDFQKQASAGITDHFGHLILNDRGTAFGADNWSTGRWSTGTVELEYDNCDFIGTTNGAINRAIDVSNDRIGWNIKKLKVTDCNFYNIHGPLFNAGNGVPFPGNHYQGAGTAELSEDYNVYKFAMNTAELGGLTKGEHSIVLNAGEPLYVNPAAGDFRLASNSPAATLNSTGTPAYTGALGVSATAVPTATHRTVGHTGATYTTVKAALTAAQAGDTITIIDNSAPYVETLDLLTSANVTLQGLPSLNPRPTLKGNGIQKPLFFSTNVANTTLKNLIIDSTNTSGTNSTVFENVRPSMYTSLINCKLVGGATTQYGVVIDQSRVMLENCEIIRPATTAQTAVLKRRAGNFSMTSCTVTSGEKALHIYAGKLVARNTSFISSSATANVIQVHGTDATYSSTSMLDFQNCLVRSASASGSANLIRLNAGALRRSLVMDNCDFIGSLAGVTPTCFDVGTTLTYASVTDSVFFKFGTTAYNMNAFAVSNTIPGLVFNPQLGFENYNAYKQAPNTLNSQGCVRGPQDVYLTSFDQLYTNAGAGDFRLSPSSPAATLNSTGMPAYAGSQGIGDESASSADSDWAIYL